MMQKVVLVKKKKKKQKVIGQENLSLNEEVALSD
jgi:hypothetical protein